MIRIWLTFIILSVAIGFATQVVRKMHNLERWNLTKTIAFSIMCSLAAVVVMMVFVVLF
jgi:uncharacterized membrane protein